MGVALPISQAPPVDEIVRLYGAGFSILPLGGGQDGKRPLTKFSDVERVPLGQVLGAMHGAGSGVYGIRLPGLAVVDCDEDNEALLRGLEHRFGETPVQVATPRGRHLYYRAEGKPPNLRSEGLPVDIKTGANAYVAGPHSVRRNGNAYTPLKGLLGADGLPPLRGTKDTALGASLAGNVPVGHRNQFLWKSAISMVEYCTSPEELIDNLCHERDERCADPASVSDAEVSGVASWAWTKRMEGNVYIGRKSRFAVSREAIDAFKALRNASDTLALYITLVDQHGHRPGKSFALDHQGMRANGHTDLSRDAFRAARNSLLETGWLRKSRNHRAGHYAARFCLSRPFEASEVIQALEARKP